jgi:hypothetical protein
MPAISNVNELQDMDLDLAGDYWLTNDIDATATVGWNGGLGFLPIVGIVEAPPGVFTLTPFTGTFNGNGFTINGLTIARSGLGIPYCDEIGLFGMIVGATIQNVTLTNVSISGSSAVGGLIGYDDSVLIPSTVLNCNVSGVVNGIDDEIGGMIGYVRNAVFSNCVADVDTTQIGGGRRIGGFAGSINGGSFTECKALGDVVSDDDLIGGFAGDIFDANISRCFAEGLVTGAGGGEEYGGFAGYAGGAAVLIDCYARGGIINGAQYIGGFIGDFGGNTIDNCYATGLVNADFAAVDVGGFCGDQFGGPISNCFWDEDTSGTAISDGGTGKSTVEMKTQTTFTDVGWDFATIWYISALINDGYPAFTWARVIVAPMITTLPATGVN